MIIRGRTLEQILTKLEASNIDAVTVAPKRYNGGTPGLEVVWIGAKARELQSILADARVTKDQLLKAEQTCLEIHKALCSIMVWIAKEEKKHEC